MNHREIGRRRGREHAAQALDLPLTLVREFERNLKLFPTLGADFDMASALLAHDARRLNCTPDYNLFPELRGLTDEVLGEREGFVEGSGFEPIHAAFFYSFSHFIWKHVNSHHVARYDLVAPQKQCTDIFFPHGVEGITHGSNRDDVLYPHAEAATCNYRPPLHLLRGEFPWVWGGVSSAVLLDEEPENIFPYAPHEHLPRECRSDIRHIMSWMSERSDFWGAGNQIWADTNLNAVAVEKTTRRVAFRRPRVNGAACITAGSYMDPDLNAYKQDKLKQVANSIGVREGESVDKLVSDGCDARYRRLMQLTDQEAARPGGATLWGTFEIISDTEVPFPERICLAGEKLDPAREPDANWTIIQQAMVVSGPTRRSLYRTLSSYSTPRPITRESPRLFLAEGTNMRSDWLNDIRAGKYVLDGKEA